MRLPSTSLRSAPHPSAPRRQRRRARCRPRQHRRSQRPSSCVLVRRRVRSSCAVMASEVSSVSSFPRQTVSSGRSHSVVGRCCSQAVVSTFTAHHVTATLAPYSDLGCRRCRTIRPCPSLVRILTLACTLNLVQVPPEAGRRAQRRGFLQLIAPEASLYAFLYRHRLLPMLLSYVHTSASRAVSYSKEVRVCTEEREKSSTE